MMCIPMMWAASNCTCVHKHEHYSVLCTWIVFQVPIWHVVFVHYKRPGSSQTSSRSLNQHKELQSSKSASETLLV